MESHAEKRLRLRDGIATPLKALSMDEAAAVAGIAVSNLYARASKGDGPRFTKIGSRTVVLLSDLEGWLLAQREATPVVERPAGV